MAGWHAARVPCGGDAGTDGGQPGREAKLTPCLFVAGLVRLVQRTGWGGRGEGAGWYRSC